MDVPPAVLSVPHHGWCGGGVVRWWAGLLVLMAAVARADLADGRKAWAEGRYEDLVSAAEEGQRESPAQPEWPLLRIRALLTLGRNLEADTALREALARDEQSIRLRWLGREVDFALGRPEEAARRLEEIPKLVRARTWAYRSPVDLVVFGRAVLQLGADPKDVLERIFATAQKADPKLRDVYLARGELALDKHDFALAAKAFEEGLKVLPDDPDLLEGRARAYAPGQRAVAAESLDTALRRNPRHVPALLQRIDALIDAEAYDEAEAFAARVVAVNPLQPDAWAYRAVLAHLRNDPAAEEAARDRALANWPRNPRVDHLIGTKLSQKYRFAEGAAAQRRAREFDPGHLPATAQLASDLLRLGEEAEGWALAREVHERDEYDVEAYNLVTLRDTMAKYAELRTDDLVVRMASREVAVYGPRVLALLRRARETLVAKYGAELVRPTFVEIFAEQKDFAVRTFGLPDVPGFLGVCFGRVVTANSPATGHATNWESVLWHEFCHVVTLQLTRNRMPRWLSEGISVYEEWQAEPSWGMRINPRYRRMILEGDLVPVGRLSAAFLAPKTPQHLQFAYLQSALVVEYIVERFGREALRAVLADLRDGTEINAALERRCVPLAQLEEGFAAHARRRAEALAPGLDFTPPDPDLLVPAAAARLAEWERTHPDNHAVLRLRAQRAMEDRRWAEARVPLERLVALYPAQKGADSAYRPLATALRSLGEARAERELLERWTAADDEAPDACLRLMELASADGDWAVVLRAAGRFLAVNPLVAPPYRHLAQAAAASGDTGAAIVAWQTLLELDPPGRAEANYQLARLLRDRGDAAGARRHVLAALEETPRYRAALQLLLELHRAAPAPPGGRPPS